MEEALEEARKLTLRRWIVALPQPAKLEAPLWMSGGTAVAPDTLQNADVVPRLQRLEEGDEALAERVAVLETYLR